MDAPQARRSKHRLRVPLVTNDLVVETDLFEKPQNALRARIVEVMDFDQGHEFRASLSTPGHSTTVRPFRAILRPSAARITQPNVTLRPMTSGRCRTPSAYPSPLIAATVPITIPT